MNTLRSVSVIFFFLIWETGVTQAQTLTLKDALNAAVANYGTIRAKENYLLASEASLERTKKTYLPDLTLSAQQDFGTVNGQNGPLFGFGGFAAASSGLPLQQQNWNAGFGALYLANINWEFFTFGRIRENIRIAGQIVERDRFDLLQEQFQHQVRVAAAYLNLIAAQRITRSQEKNLERARIFRNSTVVRAKNGLVAGVDSSLANAEVSNSKIALVRARDFEQEQYRLLANLIGVPYTEFRLDSTFISRIPDSLYEVENPPTQSHPVLDFHQSRIKVSERQEAFYKRTYLPSFSMVGIIQTRASGFSANYALDQTAFTPNYLDGITPSRSNYLIGIGMTWNLTNIVRNGLLVRSQQWISKGLQQEYEVVDQELKAQLILAGEKIKNAMANFEEAPIQVQAATDAYVQKNTLYQNGLGTIVEVTQTLYALNRAETDRDIAFTNVWQALLLKAAAAGDLELFLQEF